MKPYLLVSGDFVKTGGMDRANHALADYLSAKGREVHLVAHRAADDLLARKNVVFHRVPKPAGSYLLGAPLLDHFGRYWANRIRAKGGRVIVNGGNCLWGDVNWVHYVHAAYTPQVHAGMLRQMHNSLKHRRFLADERKALQSANCVIVNSQRTRRDVTERVGVADDRVRTIYYGIDPGAFHPGDDGERMAVRQRMGWEQGVPVVVFVGALGDRRKGFDTLFDAWQLLHRKGMWDTKLAVIGAGAELQAWKDRALDAGLAGEIDFLGFRRDVPEILRAADAIVAPTRYEAYGLGVHEALCCGLAALVSRESGVAERCPEELRDMLLLSDPDDSAELARRLETWRGSVEHYRSRVARLSDELRKHDWDHMSEQMVQAIETAA